MLIRPSMLRTFTLVPLTTRAGRLVQAFQRIDKVTLQLFKGALGGCLGAADQYVVIAGQAVGGQHQTRDLTQPAFRTVAGHGIADLLEQVNPTRTPVAVSSGWRLRACTIMPPVPCRRALAARRKSLRFFRTVKQTETAGGAFPMSALSPVMGASGGVICPISG